MSSIFVQIASYRDAQLLPTIRDCINMAKDASRLTFGICWQRDETESLEEFANDPRFKIIDVPFAESKGCCWARSQIQQLYANETYTMQIDSHMRFVEHWDEKCINMLQDLKNQGYEKPMLTGYPPSFFPDREPQGRMQWPIKVEFCKFFDQGVIDLKPVRLDGWEAMTSPVPAKFFSAGFYFTIGEFCKEIPYDPQLFFRGEEITMAIRAYTHGYDFFHPHQIILWHEYTRLSAPKNHNYTLMVQGHKRTEAFLGLTEEKIDFGIYGMGSVRSFEDYQNLSGINFKARTYNGVIC
jgi:hypothetical protein